MPYFHIPACQVFQVFQVFLPRNPPIERLESPESGDSEIQNSKSMSSFRDWGMPKLY